MQPAKTNLQISFLSSQQTYSIPTEAPPFDKTNALLLRDSPPSHKIINLIKKEQNIELIFVVLSKQSEIKTKTTDETACIFMNFFNETGTAIQQGDIIYASGVYLGSYKQMLLLYQGGMSIIRRVGRHFFRFNNTRNMSLQSLQNPKSQTTQTYNSKNI